MNSHGSERRVALFGGAFDPPHLGHVCLVTVLLNSGLVDEVWVVPSGKRPDKRYTAPAEHRSEMVRLMLEEYFPKTRCVKLVTTQVEAANTPSTTVGLLRTMRRQWPATVFLVVIGSELVQDLPRWAEASSLRQEGRFLVVGRPGEPGNVTLLEQLAPGFALTLVPNEAGVGVSLSSTKLREMLRAKCWVSGLVPPTVLEFVKKNGLYC